MYALTQAANIDCGRDEGHRPIAHLISAGPAIARRRDSYAQSETPRSSSRESPDRCEVEFRRRTHSRRTV